MNGRIIFYIVFLVQIILGLCTVNAVFHWDENKLVDSVINQYYHGHLLAEWYNYPSLIFYISYLDYFLWDHIFQHWISNFHIFNRSVFFILSQLPAIFIFHYFYQKQKPWLGIIAALVFFSSWEYHYHARWVAPDTIATTLGFISLYFAYKKSWFGSALFAGLAFGTKYTAGIFLLPIFIFFYQSNVKSLIKNYASIILTFALFFVLSTPGILFEFTKVLNDIRWEQAHYASGHYNYTVNNFGIHLYKNLFYLGLVLPSKNILISALVSIIAFVGLVSLVKKKSWKPLLVGLVFALYLIFLSSQKVMFIRNLMIFWPIIACLCILGISFTLEKIKKPILLAVPLIGILFLSQYFIFHADISIIDRKKTDQLNTFIHYLEQHPTKSIILSKELKQALANKGYVKKPVPETTLPPTQYAFYLYEAQPRQLPANTPFWIDKDFSFQEANINYYGTYKNNDRILIVHDKHILDEAGVKY